MPKNSYVSRLVPSAHEVNVVYASFDNHRADDMNTYVYASVDGGNNFRSIGEGIPKGHTVTSMTEDPKNSNVLYSGTEFGLFVSPNRGGTWTRFKGNVPTVPIHEIVFHPRDNDMILATHGRSIWILDDATPLQQYPEAIKSDAFLFDMRRRCSSTRPTIAASSPTSRSSARTRPTARRSASISRRDRPTSRCAFVMRPARRCARSPATTCAMRAAPASIASIGICGISRWRRSPVSRPVAAAVAAAVVFGGGGNNGPNVMPGEYRVTLVVDGKDVATKSVRVTGDKDMPMTDADRKTWHDTALSLHEMQRVGNAAAEAVTTLATQLSAAEALMKSAANAPASAKSAISDANTKLADLRRRLGLNQQGGGGGGGGGFGGQQGNVRGQLGQTKGQIMGSTSMPTAQQMRSSVELREDLTKAVADTNELITAIPAIYDALGASGAKPTPLKPVGPVPPAR